MACFASRFNSQDVGGFIFANQMLQISAQLPSRTLYGLGQQRNDFQLDMDWRRVTLFNHDREPADKVRDTLTLLYTVQRSCKIFGAQ